MTPKAGTRLRSVVCTTEVIVLTAPTQPVDLLCGGQPMRAREADVGQEGALDPTMAAGTLLGKRYYDPTSALEVLCTRSGEGSLSVNGQVLTVRPPKALPSSD